MVYDWENKQEICSRLYIEEKRSLEEVMEYLKEHYKFTPSKRAYQTQFRRWSFPSKQNPAHKNPLLVARIKSLWESNVTQREMLRILNEEEGFEIKERELMRVRTKNRWLLRVPNGMKGVDASAEKQEDNEGGMMGGGEMQEGGMGELQQALLDSGSAEQSQMGDDAATPGGSTSPTLPPETVLARQARLSALAADSAIRYASRKRRRRTRGWAGLPADPPGPPRFPSETTIDESKEFLQLDSDNYKDIRARFQAICEREGVIKKTLAGPERWEGVKMALITDSAHLSRLFFGDQGQRYNESGHLIPKPDVEGEAPLEQKKLALDVVCTDVTKRMRTMENRWTIAEAKNVLRINPEESRTIRNTFYRVLKEDHFTSKLEAGDEHWRELKRLWLEGSELLQRRLGEAEEMDRANGVGQGGDGEVARRRKAMEVLGRDVMKRLRDDMTKRDPGRRRKWDSAKSAEKKEMEQVEQESGDFEAQDDEMVQEPQHQQQQSMSPYAQHQQHPLPHPQPAHLSPIQQHQQQQQYRTMSDHQQHQQLPSILKQLTQQRPPPLQRHSVPDLSQFGSGVIQPHDALVAAAAHAQAQAEAQRQMDAQRHLQAQAQAQAQAQSMSNVLQSRHGGWGADDAEELRIDPSLLLAAGEPDVLDGQYTSQYSDQSQYSQTYQPMSSHHSHSHSQGMVQQHQGPIAVYFRLHPASEVQAPSRLWVATLSSASVQEVRELAVQKFPGCVVGRLEGIVKQEGGGGGEAEMPLAIESDEELGAYLSAIGGVKAVFCVQLMVDSGMGGRWE